MIEYRIKNKVGEDYSYVILDYYGTNPNRFMSLVNTYNMAERGSDGVKCVSVYASQDTCRHNWEMLEQCGHMCVCQKDKCMNCGVIKVQGRLYNHPF